MSVVVDGVTFSDDMTTLEKYPTDKTDEIYTIPDSVNKFSASAFAGNTYINKVIFPDTTKQSSIKLSANLFQGCSNLQYIEWFENIPNIPTRVFNGCFKKNSEITLPDSVDFISVSAFQDCSGLINISFNNNIRVIGNNAFQNCSSLIKIIIPPYNGTNSSFIGKGAFKGCTNLKEAVINLPFQNSSQEAFANCSNLSKITLGPKVTLIPDLCFDSCFKDENGENTIIIPSSVKTIGFCAFGNCDYLKRVEILGDNVEFRQRTGSTDFRNWAFYNCPNLEEVKFPYNAKMLENSGSLTQNELFYLCRKLKKLTITPGSNFQVINHNETTKKLTIWWQAQNDVTVGNFEIVLEDGITTIGDNWFTDCTKINQITFPNNLNEIGKNAFSGCSGIKELILPNSLKTLGLEAFKNCTSLISLTIPCFLDCNNKFTNVVTITNFVFKNASDNMTHSVTNQFSPWSKSTKINNLILEEGITTINWGTFQQCPAITSENLSIPTTLRIIKDYAFNDCSGLTGKLDLRQFTELGDYCFYNTGYTSVILPNNAEKLGKSILYNAPIEEIDFNGIRELPENIFGNATLTTLRIPDYVTSLGYDNFNYCKNLTTIITPENGELQIGGDCFRHCTNLNHIELRNVTRIADNSFNLSKTINTFVTSKKLIYLGTSIIQDGFNIQGNNTLTFYNPNLEIEDYNQFNTTDIEANFSTLKIIKNTYSITEPKSYKLLNNYSDTQPIIRPENIAAGVPMGLKFGFKYLLPDNLVDFNINQIEYGILTRISNNENYKYTDEGEKDLIIDDKNVVVPIFKLFNLTADPIKKVQTTRIPLTKIQKDLNLNADYFNTVITQIPRDLYDKTYIYLRGYVKLNNSVDDIFYTDIYNYTLNEFYNNQI